jgi:uncharacterized protein YbaA (DUF1428 family)
LRNQNSAQSPVEIERNDTTGLFRLQGSIYPAMDIRQTTTVRRLLIRASPNSTLPVPYFRRMQMARYVDGFVLPVPKKNINAYRRLSRKAGEVWREHGALEYIECVADDVKSGKLTSFPQSVKLKRGETVVFAWIVYKSRAHRDRVNAKVMKDPRLGSMMYVKSMPFDSKRMIWGGFKSIVEM